MSHDVMPERLQRDRALGASRRAPRTASASNAVAVLSARLPWGPR
jgi:hypothetical protein